jgi:hypothetical protein
VENIFALLAEPCIPLDLTLIESHYRLAHLSLWWIKPYANDHVTEINCDGTWGCDITTGGIDEHATEVAAFLVPLTYPPPLAVGWSSLPNELYMNSLAYWVDARN